MERRLTRRRPRRGRTGSSRAPTDGDQVARRTTSRRRRSHFRPPSTSTDSSERSERARRDKKKNKRNENNRKSDYRRSSIHHHYTVYIIQYHRYIKDAAPSPQGFAPLNGHQTRLSHMLTVERDSAKSDDERIRPVAADWFVRPCQPPLAS